MPRRPQLELNAHQSYLVTEFADEYLEAHMSRREMLRRVLLITGSIPATASVLLTLGCGTRADDDARPATTAAPTEPNTGTASPVATATGTAAAGATPGVPPTDPAIEAGDVRFPGPASELRAYLARPSPAGTYAGILVIHENRGLVDHIRDVARRYAKEGFVALAPDLVSRSGGTGPDPAANTGFLGRTDPADLVADLLASLDYLKAHAATRGRALGVTGFCFGGGYTFEVAAASPDVRAAVPYYGTAQRPMEALARTTAAVLAIYGEADPRITSQAPQVEERLALSGRPHRVRVYPGARHAFFNDTGQNYDPAAAADAWRETLAWFREHLA